MLTQKHTSSTFFSPSAQSPIRRRFFAVASLSFALFTLLIISLFIATPNQLLSRLTFSPQHIYAQSSDGTLNFQARLLTSSGSIVPDGTYHVEFKLYDQPTGGTELWTETRNPDTDSSDLHIQVRSGYLSVYLGDKEAFPSSIDWSNQLYLTMNIGGTDAAPSWDGEMEPRIRLTSVPRAFSAETADLALDAEQLEGRSASEFVQLSPSSQQTGAINISGNIQTAAQLQAASLSTTGNITSTNGILSIQGTGDSSIMGSLGIGTSSPQTALDVDGGIRVGGTSVNLAGVIRWTGADLQVYDGSQWASLTDGSGGGGSAGVETLNALAGSLTLQGTANQITVSDDGDETITLSLPQSIAITSNVEFNSIITDSTIAAGGSLSTSGTLTVAETSTFNGNVVVSSEQSLRLTGGDTTTRPSSPDDGTLYYDTDTNTLLVYSNGKWQADRSTATAIVAAENSTQTAKDSADFVVPDSATNAQVTINDAIDSLPASGGTVYLLEGTYTVNGSIEVQNNVSLSGSGSDSTVITIPDEHNSSINIISAGTDRVGFKIANLKIDVNGANQSSGIQYGIRFNNTGTGSGANAEDGGIVDNLLIVDSNSAGFNLFNSRHVRITNSTIIQTDDTNTSSYGIELASSEYVTINNVHVHGHGQIGIYLRSSSSNVTISNSVVEDNGRGAGINAGIYMQGAGVSSVSIMGNILSGNFPSAIRSGGGSPSYINVTNNSLDNNSSGFSIIGTNWTITGNNISNSSGDGLSAFSLQRSVIGGNTIRNNSSDGIYFSNTANNNSNIISNNVISGNGSRGIYFWRNVHSNMISNNRIADNNSAGIQFAGAPNNTVLGNRITENGSTGISVSNSVAIAENNRIIDNHVEHASSSSPAISTISTNTYLSGNTFSGTFSSYISDSGTDTIYANQIGNNGAIINRQANTTEMFQLQAANGDVLFNADTTNMRIGIGTDTPAYALDVFTADVISARFSGRVIGADAVEDDEFITLSQLTSGLGSVGGDYLQGGNAFGETAVLGTTDAESLSLITNDTERINISSTGTTTFNGNVVVASEQSLRLTGGDTSTRPASPDEGTLYFDIQTNTLLVYRDGRWRSDRSSQTAIVAPNDATQAQKDSADFVVPNSATNAQVTINNAIDSLPASGGTVYLLEGTYIVSDSIELPSNTTLSGAGNSTLIQVRDNHDDDIDVITQDDVSNGNNNIEIRQLRVHGNRDNQTTGTMRGLHFIRVGSGNASSGQSGVTISDITAEQFRTNGVRLASDSISVLARNSSFTNSVVRNNDSSGLVVTRVKDLAITGNHLSANGGSGMFVDNYTYNLRVSGNIFRANDNHGLIVNGGSASTWQGLMFSDNYFIANGAAGFRSEAQGFLNFVNNVSRNNDEEGVYIRSNQQGGILSNNRVHDNGAVGIRFWGGREYRVTENYVYGNSGTGIYAYQLRDSAISDNTIRNNGSSGIHIVFHDGNTISNNYILQNASSGVRIQSSNRNNILSNRIADNGGSGSDNAIRIAGIAPAGNRVIGNIITDTGGTSRAIETSGGTNPAEDTYLSNNIFGTGSHGVWHADGPILDNGTDTIYDNQIGNDGGIINRQANSTTMLQLQAVNGDVLFSADTDNMRIGIGTDSPSYALDVVTADAIAARFSGRVIGDDAEEDDEFITLGQANDLFGGTGGLQGSGTEGQVGFFDEEGDLAGSDNFFWNNTTNRLGIGTSNPQRTLDVSGEARIRGVDPSQTVLSVQAADNQATSVLNVVDAFGNTLFTVSQEGSASGWTEVTSSASWADRNSHASVVYNGNMWILGGGPSGSQKNDVWYSNDGNSWTQATSSADWGTRRGHGAVVFDGKMWVIGGATGAQTSIGDVWSSEDGESWTLVTDTPGWTDRKFHNVVVYDNKIWLFGGSDSSNNRLNDVWYTEDGENWVEATSSAPWTARFAADAVVYDNKIWMMGGSLAAGTYSNGVWYTEDGENWTVVTSSADWASRFAHKVVVAYDRMWLTGGNTGSNQSDVWSSIDGENWIQETSSAPWSSRNSHTVEFYSGSIWLFGGEDNSGTFGFPAPRSDVWRTTGATEATEPRVGVGTMGALYALDVVTADAIAARFSGRVIGADAVEDDEFITLGQANSLYGGTSGVTSLNTFDGALAIQGTANQIAITDNGTDTITVGLPTSVTINTLTLSNALGVGSGGTGAASFTQYGVIYGNGSGALGVTAVGSAGQCLLSDGGTGAPYWGSCSGGGTGLFTQASGFAYLDNTSDDFVLGASSIANAALYMDVSDYRLRVGNSTNRGEVRLEDGTGTATTLRAGISSADLTFTLPTADGSSGQCLKTNGSGQWQFANCNNGAGTGGALTLQDVYDASGTPAQITTSATGKNVIIRSGTGFNSAEVFSIQNATGNRVLTADTDNGRAILGHPSSLNGQLSFANSTNGNIATIQSGVTSSPYTLTLPTALGTQDQCLADVTGTGTLGWVDCDPSAVGGVGSLNGLDGSLTLQGTANQITVTDNGTDTVTLSLPSAVSINTLTLSNALAVSSGGTGATTAQGAINNISGLTTEGDLLYFDGTNTTRLARGTDGQCLVSTSTSISWQACPGGSGGIGGSGSEGQVAVFDGSGDLQGSSDFYWDNSQARLGIGTSSPDVSLDVRGEAQFRNSTDSTSAFQIQNAVGDMLFGVDTSAGSVLLGEAGATDGRLVVGNATNSNTVTIQTGETSSSYTLTLPTSAPSSGQCLVAGSSGQLQWGSCGGGGGGGGGTQEVRLSPEFAGGTLYADGTDNTGTMRADYDSTNRRNYYAWTSSQASSQDYDIVVNAQVPSDFTGNFANLTIDTWRDDNSDASATYEIVKRDGTACASGTLGFAGGIETWQSSSVSLSCTPSAGEVLIIRIKTIASNDAEVRIGDISYNYDN